MTELGKKTKGNRGGPEYRHAPMLSLVIVKMILADNENLFSFLHNCHNDGNHKHKAGHKKTMEKW